MSKIATVWLRNVVKCGKYSFAKFANFVYTFVLRAEITSFARLSAFYNISQPNFAILLISVRSFREYTFFLIKKSNGNCLFPSSLVSINGRALSQVNFVPRDRTSSWRQLMPGSHWS